MKSKIHKHNYSPKNAMSNKIKSLPIIAMSLLLYMTSCKKNKDTAQQNNPATWLTNNRTHATQTFSIDASAGGVITGTNGSRITFMPGAFKTTVGTPVIGMVDVHLLEALKYCNMLKLNTQTLGIDGGVAKLLVSGGQLKLTAYQNGMPILLIESKSTIDIPFAASPDPNMNVFYGSENTSGNLEWTMADTATITIASDSTGSYYSFPNGHLGWINCDYFWTDPAPQTEVNLVLPQRHNNANTTAWLVFPTINSVARFQGVSSTSNATLNIGHGLCPVGATVTIVVLSQVNGQYSSAFINTTITNNHSETVTLTNTTKADFESHLIIL
jgi:hypothetical protein